MDTPLDNPDMEIFTDGSSFIRDGKRKAGFAVVPLFLNCQCKYLEERKDSYPLGNILL